MGCLKFFWANCKKANGDRQTDIQTFIQTPLVVLRSCICNLKISLDITETEIQVSNYYYGWAGLSGCAATPPPWFCCESCLRERARARPAWTVISFTQQRDSTAHREKKKNRETIWFWIAPWQLRFCYDMVRIWPFGTYNCTNLKRIRDNADKYSTSTLVE